VQALRGEVWDVRVPIVGQHPAVILTNNALIDRLSSVTIAVITGTAGPEPTHITLDQDAGLTRYDTSYVNATDLHTVAQARLRRRRGRLHQAELQRLDAAIRTYFEL
jgi:mRNA interferase MazF